jgi:hypothetical protein
MLASVPWSCVCSRFAELYVLASVPWSCVCSRVLRGAVCARECFAEPRVFASAPWSCVCSRFAEPRVLAFHGAVCARECFAEPCVLASVPWPCVLASVSRSRDCSRVFRGAVCARGWESDLYSTISAQASPAGRHSLKNRSAEALRKPRADGEPCTVARCSGGEAHVPPSHDLSQNGYTGAALAPVALSVPTPWPQPALSPLLWPAIESAGSVQDQCRHSGRRVPPCRHWSRTAAPAAGTAYA